MISIDLGNEGLANTRFAISPLHAAAELLYVRACAPQSLPARWRAAVGELLRGRRLDLLATVAKEGVNGYMPDFVAPSPEAYEGDPDAELHQVATTPARRIGYEMATAPGDGPAWPCAAKRPSAELLGALECGEQRFAEQVAAQLGEFWQLLLARHWPRIRARLEEDIAHRTRVIAREGFAAMADTLHPTLSWNDSGLHLDTCCGPDHHVSRTSAKAMVLMPTVFGQRPLHSLDPHYAPYYRAPLITYPALPSPTAAAAPLDELIGTTRAQLLAQLAAPYTTEQLAQDLHLSPSTVSYHLQVLHRAGLVSRTRRARHVYYARTPSAPGRAQPSAGPSRSAAA